MNGTTLEVSVHSRSGESCEVQIRGRTIEIGQSSQTVDRDTGPAPLELFVGSIAADLAQQTHRFMQRLGLPAEVSVTARFDMAIRPALPERLQLNVLLTALPVDLRGTLTTALERTATLSSLRFRPELSISIRSLEATIG